MIENAFVSEVKLPGQKSVYELTKEQHAHLQCKKCNNIEDVKIDMECILTQVGDKTSFQVESNNLVLTGICSQCQ